MRIRLCVLSFLVLGVAAATAQQPCPPTRGSPKCGVSLFNQDPGGPVEFANFRAASGTLAGDALWKVFPKELFQRPLVNENWVTGITIPWKWHNFRTGVNGRSGMRGWELRRCVRNGSGYLVPDLQAQALYSEMSPIEGSMTIPIDNYWLIRPPLYQGSYVGPLPWVDIAVVIWAWPGHRPTDTDLWTAWRSTGERYTRAPQPSFSGRVDGANGQIEFLMPPICPEQAELAMELCFYDGVARVSATSSKTTPINPPDLGTGVGAFYNDLASTGGQVRWYFEMPGGTDPQFGFVIPLLTRHRLASPVFLAPMGCQTDFDLSDPLLALLLGSWGVLPWTRRDPLTAWDNTLCTTPWIPIPQDPSLRGATIYVGAMTFIPSTQRVWTWTNLIPTTFN